ncbi:putative ABC transporter permease [Proteinivorax hydrogeniformans]|uniref:ABC transporter permease n=1 Tax=Proteinivorax hydrogeniformans TaxID=1826727 RepID=A0AAU8HSL9_9FIRM
MLTESFFYFVFYSFVGWNLEVLYHLKKQRRFVNRGFLNGPICPIYGISATLIVILLTPFKDNLIALFIGGFIIASVVELFTGYLLERFFDTRWWDYSEESFNLWGYVCVKFSIYWGALTVFFLNAIHPFVNMLWLNIPNVIKNWIIPIFLVGIIIDSILTVSSLVQFKSILAEFDDITERLRQNVTLMKDKKLKNISLERLKRENKKLRSLQNRLINKINIQHKAWLKHYPNLKSKKFKHIIGELKEKIQNKITD